MNILTLSDVTVSLEVRSSTKTRSDYEVVVLSFDDKQILSFDKSIIEYLKSRALYDLLDK